jgi:hypothetical protein
MGGKGKGRLSPSASNPKGPLVVAAGAAKACPRRLLGVADDADGLHPTWRFSLVDHEYTDEWSWPDDPAEYLAIMRFLGEMERLTWKEIRAQMTGGRRRGALHKDIPVSNLCAVAQQRLLDLRLDDFDQMFRFRRGNFPRLWGVIMEGVFYPVWWDPEHKVCPSGDRD